jgi:hypothetical protein
VEVRSSEGLAITFWVVTYSILKLNCCAA